MISCKTKFSGIALASVLSFAVSQAHAKVWYFTGNEYGAATSVNLNAFETPGAWLDADGTAATAFSADDTYVLTNKAPTEGKFSVTELCPAEGISREALLEWAAQAEAYSEHPVALSLKAAWPMAAV